MEVQKIEVLLQRYYDASISDEEEKLLITLLNSDDLPEQYRIDKAQICSIVDWKEEEIPIPRDLEKSILRNLKKEQSPNISISKRTLYSVISVAASVVIIVSALVFLNRQPDLGSFNDPDMAYAQTQEALDLVSKYFSAGTKPLEHLNSMEEAIKPLGNLDNMNTAMQNVEHLKSLSEGLDKSRGIIAY